MTTQADTDYALWLEDHKSQLDTIGLPESLRRKLWQKLAFEDFDIGNVAKILVDENIDRTELVCTADLAKESEVYLVDHAWTFNYADMFDTLSHEPKLLERIEKMVTDCYKLDIPSKTDDEEKKEDDPVAKASKLISETTGEIDLDNLGLETLKNLPEFPEHTTQISLFGNEIQNPNEIAEKIVPLPNLKALWLNGNPVVDACSNFNAISELMPELEIINSTLTAKAGEWAMLFYAKEQGATCLSEIRALDLGGRSVLHMSSADIFGQMTNLRKLDLSDHPDFFYDEADMAIEQQKAVVGLPSD
jgi:tubulin--tyrosine ligase-like protein 12